MSIYLWPILGFVLCQFARKWRIWQLALLVWLVILGLYYFVLVRSPALTVGSTASLVLGAYGAAWGLMTQALVLRLNGQRATLIRIAGFVGMFVLTAIALSAIYF